MDALLQIGLSNAILACALAVPVALAARVCRRPALIHALWLLVLLKLVTPPFVQLPLGWQGDPPAAVEDTSVPAALANTSLAADWLPAELPALDEAEEPVELPMDPLPATVAAEPAPAQADAGVNSLSWTALLVGIWLAGSSGWLTLTVYRAWRFGRLLRWARPAPSAIQEETTALANRLGLARPPRVHVVEARIAPLLWAVGGVPRLVLPAHLVARLDADGLTALLAHELAHLARRDHVVRWLETLTTALYWWHPVLWWARHELREAEEECCDAWVVWALPQARRPYALALVETLDFLTESPGGAVMPVLASGFGAAGDLKRRLTMIMRGTTPRGLTWAGTLGVLAVAILVLPLMTAPAQQPGPGDRKPEPPREDQRRGEDMEQARNEVRKLREEMEAATNRVREMENRLRKAQDRLNDLERHGGPGQPRPGSREGDNRPRPQEGRGENRTGPTPPPPGGGQRERIEIDIRGREGQPRFERRDVIIHGGPEGRLNDLERKLDTVLRELEQMRAEMRQRPFPGKQGGPFTGGPNRQPGPGPDGDRRPGGPGPDGDRRPMGPPPGDRSEARPPGPAHPPMAPVPPNPPRRPERNEG